MYVIYIKNYKKRIYLSIVVLSGWILALLAFNFILNNSLLFKVTINNILTFSQPLDFQVESIYINKLCDSESVETSLPFYKPRMEKFSNFTSIEGKFSFDYPSVFTLSQQEFTGSEILYHIGFRSKSDPTNGFVQVWNLPYSLEDFLNNSKSTSQLNFKDFESKPVTINKLNGILWDYSFLSNTGQYFKGNEVFMKKDNKMYRISYFVPEDLWNKEQSTIFRNIVYSFKTL